MSTDLSNTPAHLREIGCKQWDPIGLLVVGEAWDQKPFADESDEYRRKVAADFVTAGRSCMRLYLLRIEREPIGLGIRVGQQDRAEATVRAIQHTVAA